MDETASPPAASAPLVESLRVRNFRTLRDFELRDLTPLTAFVGPNGSGKSTILDVFAFLHEAFTTSLRAAVESRYGLDGLRSRGETGPIGVQFSYKINDNSPLIDYGFRFNEVDGELVILREGFQAVDEVERTESVPTLLRERGPLMFRDDLKEPPALWLADHDELALPVLGQVGQQAAATSMRRFVLDWYLSDLDATDVRSIPGAGAQRRVSRTGDNVANVLEWLAQRHPERLERIDAKMREWVPQLESVRPVETGDGRFMLQLRDAPFARAIPARYASEGTLSLLAYLTVLYGPEPPALMGFEEPEENLPPQLLYALTEEFRRAAEGSQVFVNTHSPYVLNALHPDEVRVLYRDEAGFTRTVRTSDLPGVTEAVEAGAALGDLWTEGFFGVGNPLRRGGLPTRPGAG